ncbi:hypothetical protein EV215_0240 [Hypnocyclicus thermotrophus]|uniref:Cysteine-rich small domain-containing protein n=1 Tax=Hypnocyclicus thermotrophus TaxID=1627895 RepID=A0AA46E0C1_9FUSO|nr:cysteine-rich small domain-containing protein [Hypnocyclicus thermotrophus]TDT72434.1 hypothetical protein EV215_0240 [Hypnocyclicus thermotrophus]
MKNYKFFQNKNCEYFPCHKDVAQENFNCLFCFCPLYLLDKKCGGNYKYINNIKDCSNCNVPHIKGNYDLILNILKREVF